jgi:diacylglycerol diphosphate phosphatase/phosphatidate phosphatase
MGIFSKKNSDETHASTPRVHRQEKRQSRAPVAMNMSSRPSFGQWLKVTWLDILTMAAMGAIGLGVCIFYFHCLSFSLQFYYTML